MTTQQGANGDYSANRAAMSSRVPTVAALGVIAIIAAVTVMLGVLAAGIFTTDQMYIVRPLLASSAVVVIFSWVLRRRTRRNLFGEIGFIYLALALAYTLVPGIVFLASNFTFPLMGDGFNFINLAPQPAELGTHFWRLVLFMIGVATGYLAVRGKALPLEPLTANSRRSGGRLIAIWLAIIGFSILALTSLSAPVTTYIDNYTRFDHLPWILRRFVYVCSSLKNGGYIVLMALMFRQYRKYRALLFVVTALIAVYESVHSFGSRIETLTVLLAFVGFYHYKVSPISARRGGVYLLALAVLFSGIGIFRAANYNLADATTAVTQGGGSQAAEFGAVYNTSFHLYAERAQGRLPPRPWEMFFYEFIEVIPFLDHTTYNPQYWYARNYFPAASVPPQTMGVVADSAIWGGEWDLLVRSLINGALFAYLTRWFLRRRGNWIPDNIYIFCYASCVMTLKYSVLYLLIPVVQTLLPALVITGVLFRITRTPASRLARPAPFER